MTKIILSELSHTWLIDVDGTLFKHNGHKNGEDELLLGVREFWEKIPDSDVIILMSARNKQYKTSTIKALRRFGLRFDHILFDLPTGERILINDRKPSGLVTAVAINTDRDSGLVKLEITMDKR